MPEFRTKYNTLYQGIKTNSFTALCYNSIFSVRRFDIVLVNTYLTAESPLSGLDRTLYLAKILLFIAI